jgi:hypothetical protein
MTQEEIIEMARQAGFMMENSAAIQAAEIFANLVAAKATAKEREACAKVCEEYETNNDITATWLNIVADAIRARGQA